MAAEYYLLTQNGEAGTYWAGLPVDDQGDGNNYRARYGTVGNYRVYSHMNDFFYDLTYDIPVNINTDIVMEVQGAWLDIGSGYGSKGALGFKSITIASIVNGQRDPDAWHGGVLGGGYIWSFDMTLRHLFELDQPNCRIDGLDLRNPNAVNTSKYVVAFGQRAVNSTLCNCFITGPRGVSASPPGVTIYNNIIYDCTSRGLVLSEACYGTEVYHNIVTGCSTGIYHGSTANVGPQARMIGNISIDNVTNWIDIITTHARTRIIGVYNFGEAGDAVGPYDTTGTAGVMTTADFAGYAAKDFRPALATSPQVDVIPVGSDLMITNDLAGDVVPSYIDAVTDKGDAGALEFDHGNGLAPETINFTLTGLQSGSEVRVYKVSDESELFGVESSGTSFADTYTYAGNFTVNIVVHHLNYENIRIENFTLSNSAVSIPIQQQADLAYVNP